MPMDSSNTSAGSTKVAILILMGLPGSGKTTLCLSLPRFLGCEYHVIHICYDQIIPFKQVFCEEEKGFSWKNERAKVVQAAEVLLKNLVGDKCARNRQGTCDKECSQGNHEVFPDITPKCIDSVMKFKNTSGVFTSGSFCADSMCEGPRHYNQYVDSSSLQEYVINSIRDNYTILDSFSDIVSFGDKIIKCDPQNKIYVLCIDDNCYYRSMRKEWWNLAAKYELPFCIVMLKCDIEVCVKRVRERFNGSGLLCPNVPHNVIGRMDKHLEYPDKDQYPWEKYSIVIDSNSHNILAGTIPCSSVLSSSGVILDAFSLESMSKIKRLINDSLLEPAKIVNKESHVNIISSTSVIHAVDLALRKIVSESDPKIRYRVNMKRRNILEDLRNKKLVIPSQMAGDLKEDSEIKLEDYLATLINQHY